MQPFTPQQAIQDENLTLGMQTGRLQAPSEGPCLHHQTQTEYLMHARHCHTYLIAYGLNLIELDVRISMLVSHFEVPQRLVLQVKPPLTSAAIQGGYAK